MVQYHTISDKNYYYRPAYSFASLSAVSLIFVCVNFLLPFFFSRFLTKSATFFLFSRSSFSFGDWDDLVFFVSGLSLSLFIEKSWTFFLFLPLGGLMIILTSDT